MSNILVNGLNEKPQNMIKKARILVVDDEAVIREGCVKILSKEGWSVEAVENGMDGIELIKSKEFDILLLDLMMPGMNGLEVIHEVNRIAQHIDIIVITGYATVETAVEAMKEGAYDYISKPFTPDQLRVVIRRTLEKKALLLEAEFLRREQEKGLQAISHEKSKIKTILNCMPNGVLVLDNEKRLILYNPIAGKLLNIREEDSIGKLIDECVYCKDLSDMISEVLNRDYIENTYISGEISADNPLSLMAHNAPIVMEDGEVLGVVVIVQDISEQKAIDKMKADFIAKVTHELKAPVATMNQLLMAIEAGVVGELEGKQLELIERAKLRGEGLLELISDLLDISKIESGLSIQRMIPLNIREIMEDVVDLLKPQADKKGISLNLHIDDNLPLINADKDGMREVFTNLISNGIKYTNDGGKIEIDGSMDKDYFIFSISDNGIGISKQNLPFIFERFFRVKNSKTRHIVGTGLGLPIVKDIIDAHLGSIEVKSDEGKGSTFKVLLPMKIE
ncbi:MAG: response regulator [Spirochaetota bacterium]|nr:response regulator [Spirochaetota bacterium]